MKDSLANTTRPILSCSRAEMKSLMTVFAALSLLRNCMSVLDMLPEISSASTISTPSPVITVRALTICGWAVAIISNAIDISLRNIRMGDSFNFHDLFGVCACDMYEYRMLASFRFLNPEVATSITRGKIGNKTRIHGVANLTSAFLLSSISIG